MASWGTKRRNTTIFLFLLIVTIFTAAIGFFFFYEEPTCFDNRKNGDELGIDCGGNCSLLCATQISDPVVHWKRFFEVSSRVYNTIAYIENQNPDAGASKVPYSFKLYNKENVLLREKTGLIDIKPKQVTPIIENNLDTGKLKASRVSFEFTEKINWNKQQPLEQIVSIKNQEIFEVDGLPRVSAQIKNNTLETLKNLRFVVIIYDSNDNAIATSNTLITRLIKDQEQNIIFTWPIRFEPEATRFEIIPVYELGF